MAKALNISTARRELPALFDRVTTRDGEKVVIRRRDGTQEAVLVSRNYVERLEIASRRAGPTFRLLGSATLPVPEEDVEQIIAEVRAAESVESEKRARELASSRSKKR